MALILKRVGRYELLKEVGRGGMATVYLARQTDLDRHVALKELASLHSADEAFAERFLRESRMAGSLSHPNIVTVHDYFEHEGTPYISMEYIERGSLRPLVGHLTLAQIGGVLEGLLAGLQHAASRGIVHRDMKPENVMVTGEGGVKISDFGIGRALNQAGNASKFLTATGTAIGTPAYMAPEQAMAKEVGPWTDLYSLGIMAYEMVLGEVPFSDSETPMSMLVRHVSETIPAPSTINPSIDPQLSEWLEWLLKKDPTDRPPSAGEAWDKLEEIVIHLLGPRWRREARLGDGEGEPHADEDAKPLTPAPFSEERSKVSLETPQPEYVTVDPAAAEAAAAAAAAGVAAAAASAALPAEAEPASEPIPEAPVAEEPIAEAPAAPEPAAAEPAAPESAAPEPVEPIAEEPPPAAEEPETPEGSLDLGDEEEDMYLTFAPGAKKAVAPPPPPPARADEPPAAPAPEPSAPAAVPVAEAPAAAAHAPAETPAPVAAAPVEAAPVEAAAQAAEPVPPAPAAAEAAPPAAAPPPPLEPEPAASEPEHDHSAAAAATGAVAAAAAAAAAAPKPKRGLGRLKKPNIPKLPELPKIPNLPPEVQQFAPGVAGEIGQANAEVAAVPQAARLPSAGQEFDQAMPEVAEHVAEAQAVVGGTPGAPSIPKPHVSHTREPIAPAAAAAAPPEAPAPEVHEKKKRGGRIAGAAAAGAAAAAAVPAASAAAPPAVPPPAAPPPSPPTDEPPAGPPDEKGPSSTPLAPDLRVTVPPDKAPKAVEHPSFVLTDAVKALDQEKETKVRIKPVWIVVALALVAVAVVAVIVLAGGGSSKKAGTTQTTASTQATTAQSTTRPATTTAPPVIAEVPPTAIQQQSIAGAGGGSLVVASPGGAIERLSGATLKPIATTTDPAGPTSVSQSYGRVYVTDNGTIATYKLNDLSPIDAVSFPGAYALAGGGANLPLYALARSGVDSGRLCAIKPQGASPCATLAFAPSGGGVHRISSGRSVVYVTDRASASVIPYTATKASLTAGTPIKLPQQPQGDPVAVGSTLYVPIRRGIAVIDTNTGKVVSTIALPVSPLSLAANGKKQLFAALFSTNQVAALTLSKPGATPAIKLIKVQKGPIALASSGGSVYVVNGATDSAQKLNPATLAVTSVSRLPSLGSNTPPITAQAPRIVANGRTVTVTVPLQGGTLPASGLAVTSTKISGGKAAATLWQGGIKTKGDTKSAHGVSVTTSPHPGRVDVVLHTRAGDFEKVVVIRAGDGSAVSFTLTEPPPPPPPTTPETTPQTTPQTTPATTPQTTPATTPPPTTPATTPTTTPATTPTTTPATTPPPPTHTTTQTFTVG